MCAILKPVDETRLVVPDHVAVVGHRSVYCPLVHDQLHRLDPVVEMCVEIPGNGGIGDLIMLLLGLVLAVLNKD